MKMKNWVLCVLIIVILCTLGCQNQSTISVLGTGTVLAQPDVIQMTITLSNVSQSTRTAQEAVNRMVRQALAILKDAGIEDKNISTASLTFRSEYEYTTRRILIGQRAEQILTFSIDDINNDTENGKVSRIIDQLIQINGIEMHQVNFVVKNNTEYFVRSRELAFQKAMEKANQYAELSNLKIKKVLSISEEVHQQNTPVNKFTNQLVFAESARDAAGSTIIPTGELEITTNIMVVFVLE
ncbi:MAG: SIMPL domain-containing protein [Treponema sp.]|nr:SIMPL domain-containing protein [Treponema sp.]